MVRLSESTKHYWDAVMDFVYPNVCLRCEVRVSEKNVMICEDCWSQLPRNKLHTLHSGDRYLTKKKHFPFVANRFIFGKSEYGEVVRELIHLFKFSYYPFLHKKFGEEMAETLINVPELAVCDLLIPVPLHRARRRERGFNQSELLAGNISERTGIPVDTTLEKIINNRPQASIGDRNEKEKNVQGIFAVSKNANLKNKRVILIDDMFTTGATANECAKVLKKSGAEEVYILTAALVE